MSDDTELENELRALGRTLIISPPADDLAEQVLARLQTGRPGPIKRSWLWLLRSRRRLVAMIIAAVIIALGLTPPVRATVLNWLRIGGVVIRTSPAPATSVSPTPELPPASGPTRTIAEAQRLVDLPLTVPEQLGPPDRVTVSDDRRVVSMYWRTGPAQYHLDQFDGQLSWVFVKQSWEDVTPASVCGREAVWLAKPHPIVYVDRQGQEHGEQTRIAGPSLVWQRTTGTTEITVRLEGTQFGVGAGHR